MSTETELPHSTESERNVIGTILFDGQAYETVAEEIQGDEFYHSELSTIYAAMQQLNAEGEEINLQSIVVKLQQSKKLKDIGGVGFLSNLMSGVVSSAQIKFYTKIVKDKSIIRSTMLYAKKLYFEAMAAETPETVIAGMQETVSTLMDRTAQKSEFRPIREVVQESFDGIEKRYTSRSEGGVTGIPSGYTDLDRMTAGFQKNDLIIVAARPSVGKTAFALNIAQNVGTKTGETVAIFSLEMSASQLVDRMLSAEGNIDAGRLRTGYIDGDDWEHLTMACGSLTDAEIFIDDTPGINVHEIRAKCRRLKKNKGLGLIIIDYLQLIPGRGKGGENRQQEVSEISRTLKLIARELEVPVIALSQLSRSVDQRQDKRPMMSDLRESGAIEQDADIVAFLYRDDYYDKESEKKNIIEIIIAKQRNGPVGTVELVFLKNYNKFVNLDRSYQEQKPQLQVVRNTPSRGRRGYREHN